MIKMTFPALALVCVTLLGCAQLHAQTTPTTGTTPGTAGAGTDNTTRTLPGATGTPGTAGSTNGTVPGAASDSTGSGSMNGSGSGSTGMGSGSGQTSSKTGSPSGAMSGSSMDGSDQDKQFLMTASQSDYTEMKFSQLATQKASNGRVKTYAQKMITDHTKLEADMKPFADKWGVTPVMTLDADHQAKYDALSSMSGMDFDKTYMMGMDADHHTALDAFKAEESATTNPEFKKTVAKGEKVVAQHTEMADKAVKMMGGTPGSGM